MSQDTKEPFQVLIVDDVSSDRQMLRRYLTEGTELHCQVVETSSAEQARAQIQRRLPHCVLLDYDLPDCDGLSLVRQLVEDHGTHAFGIVMLTASSGFQVAVEALKCGAHDFLPKWSADAISLCRAVGHAVEKAAIQRELELQRLALAEKNRQLEVHVARLEQEVAERQRAELLLRRSEQQLRFVTDHAAVLLAHCGADLRYKFVNRPYAARFGLAPHDIIGRHVRDVVGSTFFAAIEPYARQALTGKEVEFEVEVPFGKTGTRWMNIVYAPERLLDGRVVGLVGIMTDTTQRKSVEQDLKTARDQAVAASRAKDDFLAALSHELRTPLNPVLLLASSAAADSSFSLEARSVFETIRKNVDLEARLIDDLLNITHISRGKLALDIRQVEIHPVLKDAIANVSSDAAQKHLSLRFAFNARQHIVDGDPVRLQQIFWNVLKNAVKFTAEGGEITLATSNPSENEIEISVVDTGIGMTAEELSRVFEAFTQGEHAGKGGSHRFGGLGLGLAISRMLVESHAGTIRANSAGRGLGSTFSIILPLAAPVVEDYPTQRGVRMLPPAAGNSGRAASTRILLVEDHEATRAALSQLLLRRKYEVTAVGSASEALAVAGEQAYDLVISDIGLPDGTGYDLMTALARRHPGRTRGIALTGYGMERDIGLSRKAGFHAHLTKPIRMDALERAIAETLGFACQATQR